MSFTDKFKELKDKLDNTHLHNAKVHLNHKKYARHTPYWNGWTGAN